MTFTEVQIPGYLAGTWQIDPTHSHVGFMIKHMMVSKVRGHFTSFRGQIVTAPEPLRSSVTATKESAMTAIVRVIPQALLLEVEIPGIDEQACQQLAEEPHRVCPYSKATRGNIPVEIRARWRLNRTVQG